MAEYQKTCKHPMVHSMTSLEEIAIKDPNPHKVKCLDYRCRQEMYLPHFYIRDGEFNLVRRSVISAKMETVTVPIYVLREIVEEKE